MLPRFTSQYFMPSRSSRRYRHSEDSLKGCFVCCGNLVRWAIQINSMNMEIAIESRWWLRTKVKSSQLTCLAPSCFFLVSLNCIFWTLRVIGRFLNIWKWMSNQILGQMMTEFSFFGWTIPLHFHLFFIQSCSYQLKWTPVAVKYQQTLFIFTDYDYRGSFDYFQVVPCTILCYDLKTLLS